MFRLIYFKQPHMCIAFFMLLNTGFALEYCYSTQSPYSSCTNMLILQNVTLSSTGNLRIHFI